MVDLSFIGKEGLIIQYEDIVSMIGFNIIRYFKIKNANKKAMGMSLQDILVSYMNRVYEDPEDWLKNEFGIDFKMDDYIDSINAFQPNWLYSFKVFDTAYKNGVKKLMIHSKREIPIVKKIITTYTVPVEYSYGDIVPVLEKNKNITFLTSLPSSIKRCSDTDVPCAITIVDDFMYTADIVINKIEDKLKRSNKFVTYTSIMSGGLINLDK